MTFDRLRPSSLIRSIGSVDGFASFLASAGFATSLAVGSSFVVAGAAAGRGGPAREAGDGEQEQASSLRAVGASGDLERGSTSARQRSTGMLTILVRWRSDRRGGRGCPCRAAANNGQEKSLHPVAWCSLRVSDQVAGHRLAHGCRPGSARQARATRISGQAGGIGTIRAGNREVLRPLARQVGGKGPGQGRDRVPGPCDPMRKNNARAFSTPWRSSVATSARELVELARLAGGGDQQGGCVDDPATITGGRRSGSKRGHETDGLPSAVGSDQALRRSSALGGRPLRQRGSSEPSQWTAGGGSPPRQRRSAN